MDIESVIKMHMVPRAFCRTLRSSSFPVSLLPSSLLRSSYFNQMTDSQKDRLLEEEVA